MISQVDAVRLRTFANAIVTEKAMTTIALISLSKLYVKREADNEGESIADALARLHHGILVPIINATPTLPGMRLDAARLGLVSKALIFVADGADVDRIITKLKASGRRAPTSETA